MSKFKIEVRNDDIGKVQMSITHNGRQWTTLWFHREELPVVISEIQRYLLAEVTDEG